MAFPANPAHNQVFVLGNMSYVYDLPTKQWKSPPPFSVFEGEVAGQPAGSVAFQRPTSTVPGDINVVGPGRSYSIGPEVIHRNNYQQLASGVILADNMHLYKLVQIFMTAKPVNADYNGNFRVTCTDGKRVRYNNPFIVNCWGQSQEIMAQWHDNDDIRFHLGRANIEATFEISIVRPDLNPGENSIFIDGMSMGRPSVNDTYESGGQLIYTPSSPLKLIQFVPFSGQPWKIHSMAWGWI